MYCKNCNAYNNDDSRFCCQCGATLDAPQWENPQPSDYADQYSAPNAEQPIYGSPENSAASQQNAPFDRQPYDQNGYSYRMTQPNAPLNNTMAIIMLVVNIVVFNVIGLAFAVLALMSYNKYESALRLGDIAMAESYKTKSKRYSKISLVVAIVFAVIGVIIGIVAIGLFIFGGMTIIDESVYPYYEFENYMMMIKSLI